MATYLRRNGSGHGSQDQESSWLHTRQDSAAQRAPASTLYEVLKVVSWVDVKEQIRLWSADVVKARLAAGLEDDALASPPSGHPADLYALAHRWQDDEGELEA